MFTFGKKCIFYNTDLFLQKITFVIILKQLFASSVVSKT